MNITSPMNSGLLRSPDEESGGGTAPTPVAVTIPHQEISHDADLNALFADEAPAAPPVADEKPAPAPVVAAAQEKPPAAVEPVTEHPEDKFSADAKSSPDTRSQFAKLKEITKQLRVELAAREVKLVEAEKLRSAPVQAAAAVVPPEFEKLKGEHKAMSDRMALLDLQSHPDFVRQYVEPKTKILDGVKMVLADNNIDGSDLATLAGKPRAEFAKVVNEIASRLPAFEQATFVADMRQLHAMEAGGREALAKAADIRAQLGEQANQRARAAFEDTWKSPEVNTDALARLEAPAGASEAEKASIAAYNAGIGGIRSTAEKLAFEGTDERGMALVASKAASFDFFRTHAVPRMEARYQEATKLIADLTAEISGLRGARKVSGTSSQSSGGGEKPIHEMDHAEASRKVWGG